MTSAQPKVTLDLALAHGLTPEEYEKIWDQMYFSTQYYGRKGLVVGIANQQSIAYGCARMFRTCGAELAMTWLNDDGSRLTAMRLYYAAGSATASPTARGRSWPGSPIRS